MQKQNYDLGSEIQSSCDLMDNLTAKFENQSFREINTTADSNKNSDNKNDRVHMIYETVFQEDMKRERDLMDQNIDQMKKVTSKSFNSV